MLARRSNALAVALAILLPLGASAAASERPEAQVVGRYAVANGKDIVLGWPGSTLRIAFKGTRLAVRLTDGGSNKMAVIVDGNISRLDLKKGEETYVVAAGLPNAAHEVEIVRRTEGFFWPTVFHGAETDGELLAAPLPADKRLLMIGDSVAAGYGIEGSDKSCKFSPDTENQYATYAAIAGRAFGADVTTLAWSGYGLMHGYGGSTSETLPSIWTRLVPTDPGSTADFSDSFDVVVVNLGGNDFANTSPGPGFQQAYTAFLALLRSKFPGARIYATIGPNIREPRYTEAVGAISASVAERQAAGDKNVTFIGFVAGGPGEWGCDWHPNVAGHERMAAKLISELEHDLGWRRRSSPEAATQPEK